MLPTTPHRSLRRVIAALLVPAALATVVAGFATPAAAAPKTLKFGPLIDAYVPYKPQSTCSPTVKPGLAAFRELLLKSYPKTRWIGITRDCNVGGRSEHKEGRALDWALDANNAAERAIADEFLAWLMATDRYGNPHAMLRRLGIMYVMWNRRIWGVWDKQWKVYCVQRKRGCVNSSGNVVHPHDDHIHFSFGWPGARMKTSFFWPERSWVVGMDSSKAGYWLGGGNGNVRAVGTPYLGQRGGFLKASFADLEATSSGKGYWLLMANGRVFPFGDAMHHGAAQRKQPTLVGMAARPQADGYWIVGRAGSVRAFGEAPALGGATKAAVVGMAATPTGRGYWLFSESGRVYAFGDAEHLGDLSDRSLNLPIVSGAARPQGDGYWLVNRGGKVFRFGAARHHGNLERPSPVRPVSAIAPTASGRGYWLAGRHGKVAIFGDATGQTGF